MSEPEPAFGFVGIWEHKDDTRVVMGETFSMNRSRSWTYVLDHAARMRTFGVAYWDSCQVRIPELGFPADAARAKQIAWLKRHRYAVVPARVDVVTARVDPPADVA